MAAAYAASCRRALLMGHRLYGGPNQTGLGLRFVPVSQHRAFAAVVKPSSRRLIPVDTLALVRKLEANGVPTKQAEAITEAFKEVQNDNYDNVCHNFVSKFDMEKSVMTLESNSSKLETQVTSNVNHHFSLLQQENEKLKTDIEKIRSELRYEIDKVTTGLRLDLNLEKGRIRDEMNNQNQETINLNSKVDREIHVMRALIEALKYEMIKYMLGTLASLSAVGLALLRILL